MSEELAQLEAMEIICAALRSLESLEPSARDLTVQWLLGALSTSDSVATGSTITPEHQHSVDGSSKGPQSVHRIQNSDGVQTTPRDTRNDIIITESTPKEFIRQKQPQSVVERITCLAFYLTHHRGMPTYGGAEIDALNTQAAAASINRTRDLDNARRAGYLVSAGDGKKQITTKGEDLVQALPDREAVKAALSKYPPQRKRKPSSSTKKRGTTNGDAE